MHIIVPAKCALHKFEVGSMVQFNDPPQFGVIKWIGTLPGSDIETAGVETVSKNLAII